MKTSESCALALALGGIVFLREPSFSYDNTKAHPAINRAIVAHCEANTSKIFSSTYALKISTNTGTYKGPAVTNPGFFDLSTTESEKEYRSLEWIAHGGYSADEPELGAAVRHFYDPVALSGGRKYLTNRGTYWEGVYSNPGIDAIEWALGDTPKGSANNWSLAKGKEYLKNVLELADSAMKARNLARALRCLGEVLHDTGDMGCPPHTRNDSHAAPLGYSGAAVLGSPDPYEELFDPQYADLYRDNSPDPVLESFFASATSIRAIDEKLAEFTNQNFFTAQTINGKGYKITAPINADGKYPAPLLEDLDYNSSDYSYYKSFADGNRVKMCKDRSYFGLRGYPYIDKDCVRSQASALIPNIICAGRNIIRLFMPQLTVELTGAGSDGSIKGRVTHVPGSEYKEVIYYSGPVSVFDAATTNKLGTCNCNTGDFSGVIAGLKTGDKLYAKIDIGGISVQSATREITTGFDLKSCDWIFLSLDADMSKGAGYPYNDVHAKIDNADVPQGNVFSPAVWNGTSFQSAYLYKYAGASITGALRGQISADGTKILSIQGELSREYAGGYTTPPVKIVFKISAHDLAWSDNRFPTCRLQGSAIQSVLTSVFYSMQDSSRQIPYFESTSINWNSSPLPVLYVMFDKKNF